MNKIAALFYSISALALPGCSTVQDYIDNLGNKIDRPGSKTAEFAVVGDNPYDRETEIRYQATLNKISTDPNIAFVIHVGDINSSENCQQIGDKVERLHGSENLSIPMVLTPGDNEIIQCPNGWRDALYGDYDNDPNGVVSQEGFEENKRWEFANVTFATMNLYNGPGSTPQERERTTQSAVDWLQEAFQQARENDSRGIFLTTHMQIWPYFSSPNFSQKIKNELDASNRDKFQYVGGLANDVNINNYDRFHRELKALTINYPNPVVLAVGHAHIFRIDQPMVIGTEEVVSNFTRIQPAGEPDTHWIRAEITHPPDNPDDFDEVFEFKQELEIR